MSTAEVWWRTVKGRGRFALAVVIGPRECGKSSWFRVLAADPAQDVVLWDALEVARVDSTDEVWGSLWKALGFTPLAPGDEPTEYIDLELEQRGRGLTLVVDNWDQAIGEAGAEGGRSVPDACYEVLHALSTFCIDQERSGDRRRFLGLVLLTSLPASSDLEFFAKRAQRPRFQRLSGLVTRTFRHQQFPMLDRSEAESVLQGHGLDRGAARAVAGQCGGWLRLLLRAAPFVRDHDGSTATALADYCAETVPGLLEDSIFDWMARRPAVVSSGCTPAEYLEQQLAEGRPPAQFGLPHDFAHPARPAPVVRRALRRTFLVVDTENLYMPFKNHARTDPAEYAPDGGVDRFVQDRVEPWLRALVEQHDVDDADVFFVGWSRVRIAATVGSTPGRPFWPEEPRRIKEKWDPAVGKPCADDQLMCTLIGQNAGRHPLAEFVLVTGDMDASMALSALGTLDRIHVAAPWKVSRRLHRYFAGTGRLDEDGLERRGVPRPTAVVRA